MLRRVLSNNRAGLHKELGLLALILLIGCTYIETQESGMTEFDYKMYNEGWEQKMEVINGIEHIYYVNEFTDNDTFAGAEEFKEL